MNESKTIITRAAGSITETIASIAAFLVPFALYCATIAPTVTAGDAGEFIVALNNFSMPHAPGYPLYMSLLKIWRAIPINLGADPLAVKTNLFSAFTMSLAIWLFYRSARKLTGSPAAAITAAFTLAVTRHLWKFAVVTEVYSLHILLISLVIYGLAVAREEKQGWGLILTSFAFGMGLTHHGTMILMLPFILFLWPRGKNAPKYPAGLIPVAFLVPFLVFLILPFMAANTPPYNDANVKFGYEDFYRIVTRAEVFERVKWYKDSGEPLVQPADIFTRILKYLPKQFSYPLLVWAIIGLFMAPAGKRVWALMFGVTVILWIGMYSFFSRGGPLGMPFSFLRSTDELMIPLNLFLSFGLAWGFAPAVRYLVGTKDIEGTEDIKFVKPNQALAVATLLFCVFPLFLGMYNGKWSNFSKHTFAQDMARNILEQVPEKGVLIVSGDESFLYEYLQEVRGIRRDVDVMVYPFRTVVSDGESDFILPPANSLAHFIDLELAGRDCVFSFSPPAGILPLLRTPRALRLDGVAQTLIVREEGMDEFVVGDPNIWTKYQLRNVDAATLSNTFPDDFEYEIFERYMNGMNASVAKLESMGFGRDDATLELKFLAQVYQIILKRTDYPFPPTK